MKTIIYIVDDDANVRDIFKIILKKAGYDLKLFESGTDLLENAGNIPDLFIIDQQLPGMKGLDICIGLKSNNLTKHVPVIIISATPDLDTAVKLAGADAYLKKPLTKNDLLNAVEKFSKMKVN
ncbi:MAG: response regulator [Ginsengibacter sp.]